MPDAGSVWYSGSRKSGNRWRKAVTENYQVKACEKSARIIDKTGKPP